MSESERRLLCFPEYIGNEKIIRIPPELLASGNGCSLSCGNFIRTIRTGISPFILRQFNPELGTRSGSYRNRCEEVVTKCLVSMRTAFWGSKRVRKSLPKYVGVNKRRYNSIQILWPQENGKNSNEFGSDFLSHSLPQLPRSVSETRCSPTELPAPWREPSVFPFWATE